MCSPWESIFKINFILRSFVFEVITDNKSALCYLSSVLWSKLILFSPNEETIGGQDSSWYFIKSLIAQLVPLVSMFTELQTPCPISGVFMNSVSSGVPPLARVWLSVESVIMSNHCLHHSSCWCEELRLMVLRCQTIQDVLETGT